MKITEYGAGVTAEAEPADAEYATFTAGPLTFPGGACTVTFQGLNPRGGDTTILIDDVKIDGTLLDNGDFESPNVSDYEVAPANATWSFAGTSGLAADGGTYTSSNPSAPSGDQVAFVRKTGAVTLTFSTLPLASTHTLTFKAAQRGDSSDGNQRIRVSIRSSTSIQDVKTFVWCGDQICEQRDGTGATVVKRYFAEGEQRVGGIDAGNYYYTRDHLRSVREITDSNGFVKARYDYDPYGNEVALEGKLDNDFGFAGHYYHARSGLNLALYRAYDPKLGRWLARDPLKDAEIRQGANLYSYVRNDPINVIDPLGLDTWSLRVNLSIVIWQFTLSGTYSTVDGTISTQVANGFGLTLGASLTGGLTQTNAPNARALEGISNAGGITAGEAFVGELNYVWTDDYNGLESGDPCLKGYNGIDFGIGLGIGAPISPQYFRNFGDENIYWRNNPTR